MDEKKHLCQEIEDFCHSVFESDLAAFFILSPIYTVETFVFLHDLQFFACHVFDRENREFAPMTNFEFLTAKEGGCDLG